MIDTEDLRELQANFESVRLYGQAKHKAWEKLRCEFVRCFPRNRLATLSLDQYVQGKGSKESFCYWVERRTVDLGHIQGTPVKKFGVYFDKKSKHFRFTRRFLTADEALTSVLASLCNLYDAARDGDLDAIRRVPISSMFKGKVLYLYFPKRFINIFSERHVDHFLAQLRLNDPGSNEDVIAKREKLYEFKNDDEIMKDWTTFEFSDFLYFSWRPLPRDQEGVVAKLKDYMPSFPRPEETNPEFIDWALGECSDNNETKDPGGRGRIDFEKRNRQNKLTGNQGEDVVLVAERQELTQSGRPDLAAKVKAVCKEDDGFGYDILSFDLEGKEKQIEVKATTASLPARDSQFRFFLSETEYEQAHKLPNFHLYIVFDVKSKQPKIWRIPRPNLESKLFKLKPSAFNVTIRIVSRE